MTDQSVNLDDLIANVNQPAPVSKPNTSVPAPVKVPDRVWAANNSISAEIADEGVCLDSLLSNATNTFTPITQQPSAVKVPENVWASDNQLGSYLQLIKNNAATQVARVESNRQNGIRYTLPISTDVYPSPQNFTLATFYYSNEFHTFVVQPNCVKSLQNGGGLHKFHILGNGELCIPKGYAAEHRDSVVFWLACLRHYLATGVDSGFRNFDPS